MMAPTGCEVNGEANRRGVTVLSDLPAHAVPCRQGSVTDWSPLIATTERTKCGLGAGSHGSCGRRCRGVPLTHADIGI
jgi:hypothetical protein